MEIWFKIINATVIPAWLLIAFFPKNEWTKKLILSYAFHLFLAVFYTFFIFWGMYENSGGEGGMDSLAALRIGFLNDKVLLAAWAHYLVFDLFVGVWIVKDAEAKDYNSWLLKPILLFTLMLGPFGFLLYKLYSFFKR